MHAVNLPGALYRAIQAAKTIRLRGSGQIDQSFALSNLAPVARALDRCIADLRQVWNVDEGSPQVRQEPKLIKPLSQLFSTDDYPRDAWVANAGGTVALILLVDETG